LTLLLLFGYGIVASAIEALADAVSSLPVPAFELELVVLLVVVTARIWKPQRGQQEAVSARNVSIKEELEVEVRIVAKEEVVEEEREVQEKDRSVVLSLVGGALRSVLAAPPPVEFVATVVNGWDTDGDDDDDDDGDDCVG
jgi:hypothetical protein